jgi:hypothetical protein
VPPDEPSTETVLQTIAFTSVGDLFVLCHARASPSDDEWDTWARYEALRRNRGILISTAGGAPNSSQRARIAKNSKPDQLRGPVALLTDSAVLRGLLIAFGWLLGDQQRMRAFAPGAVEDALTWLNVDIARPRVEAVLVRLHTALGGPDRH